MRIDIYDFNEENLKAAADQFSRMPVCYACGQRGTLVVRYEDFRKVLEMKAHKPDSGTIFGLQIAVEEGIVDSFIEAR